MSPTPVPPGFTIMKDPVPLAVTAFALEVFHDATTYPMGAGVIRTIGNLDVFARVELHPPDFQNHVEHRGVTCYAKPATATSSRPTDPSPPLRASGCDVSHYQGGLQWADLAQRGCAFAFLKATEGVSYVDANFLSNAELSRARAPRWRGVLRGAYHFFRPAADVDAQIAHFIATMAQAGPLELPPALDVEVADGVPPALLAQHVEHAVDLIAASGRRPLVYASPGLWRALTGDLHLAAKADLWVAHYGVAKPSLCGDWTDWQFWQSSDRSTFAGDSDTYKGTLEELRAAFPPGA